MRKAIVVLSIVVEAGVVVPAAAQPGITEIADEPALRIGAEMAMLPSGTLTFSDDLTRVSSTTATALAFGGVLQRPIGHAITVELAPRFIASVRAAGMDPASELDLRVRITGGG